MMENWECGTRNASGAKVRTYASDLPRLRMSTPRSGYVPFQYEKAYGVKNAVGIRMVQKCTQAKIPAWSRKNDFAAVHAATGRRSGGIVRCNRNAYKQTRRSQSETRNKRPARLLRERKPSRNAIRNDRVQSRLRNRKGLRRKRRNACNRENPD